MVFSNFLKKKHKNSRNAGHRAGINTVESIIGECLKKNIKYLTLYTFSTENWKRPKKEINFLFKLIKNYFSNEINNIVDQGIKINILGNINALSPDIKLSLKKTISLTENNKKIIVNLAINYGSQNEIINAFKKTKKNFNINNFEKNLYTKNLKNPDILIRTGGHKRLSNFMLWQLAYAELFFLSKLWPDFTTSDLIRIIKNYTKRKRNFGNI